MNSNRALIEHSLIVLELQNSSLIMRFLAIYHLETKNTTPYRCIRGTQAPPHYLTIAGICKGLCSLLLSHVEFLDCTRY